MLEKVNFADLLRYGFNGGVLLLALALTYNSSNSTIFGGVGLAHSSGLALIAVVVGSFIYTLHGALFFSLITRFLMWLLKRKYPMCALPQSDPFLVKSFKRDYARWIRRSKYPDFQRNFDTWASQIHFLYGCFWALLIGAVIGRCLSPAIHGHDWCYFFFGDEGGWAFCISLVLSALSLGGALHLDYYALYYDCSLMRQTYDALYCDCSHIRETKRSDEVA